MRVLNKLPSSPDRAMVDAAMEQQIIEDGEIVSRVLSKAISSPNHYPVPDTVAATKGGSGYDQAPPPDSPTAGAAAGDRGSGIGRTFSAPHPPSGSGTAAPAPQGSPAAAAAAFKRRLQMEEAAAAGTSQLRQVDLQQQQQHPRQHAQQQQQQQPQGLGPRSSRRVLDLSEVSVRALSQPQQQQQRRPGQYAQHHEQQGQGQQQQQQRGQQDVFRQRHQWLEDFPTLRDVTIRRSGDGGGGNGYGGNEEGGDGGGQNSGGGSSLSSQHRGSSRVAR